MSAVVFYPDVKYQRKLFLIVSLAGLIALAGSGFLGVMIGNEEGGASGAQIGALIAAVGNLIWFVPAWLFIPLYYRRLRYEIHDDEAIVYVGVVTRSVKHVPFRTVTNLQVKQGPFDRLFGIGTLNIQTAGMSGQTGAEESLEGLVNFQQVYEQVARELRRFRGVMAPTQAEVEPLSADGQLGAILDEVRAIRSALEKR